MTEKLEQVCVRNHETDKLVIREFTMPNGVISTPDVGLAQDRMPDGSAVHAMRAILHWAEAIRNRESMLR